MHYKEETQGKLHNENQFEGVAESDNMLHFVDGDSESQDENTEEVG